MPFIIRKTNSCPASKPFGVFTEQGHGSGKTKGSPHGCFTSESAAREQQKALYASVPEANSEAPPPPNLRDAEEGSKESCSSCHMYDADTKVCWGFGNIHVEPQEICDNYSPEPAVESKAGTEASMSATVSPALTPNTLAWRQARAREMTDSQRRRPETREVNAPLELQEEVRRQSDSGETVNIRTLRSYASLFDEAYTVGSSGYRFEESVKPGAFKRSLGQKPDVVFRYNHTGPPLARTTNSLGKSPTLRLGEDSKGLWYEADLDLSDPDVQALIPKIERGDLSESSFAFRCVRDSWNDDSTTRALDECNLDRGDVSVVTFGASRATGRHLLLRSEEAIRALQEVGPEKFLSAWVEWRDYTLLPLEERTGKVLSSDSMQILRQVLDLISDADEAVDQAQPLLADLMGVPNPDTDTTPNNGSVTGSEQLENIGRDDDAQREDFWKAVNEIAKTSPYYIHRGENGTVYLADRESDDALAVPKLLDGVLNGLVRAQRNFQGLYESEVLEKIEESSFNAEDLKTQLEGAEEQARKLDEHLALFPSDPEVHRSERERLTSQRAVEEANERRDDPTDADWGVMSQLKNVKLCLASAKACQLADPDYQSDPDDQAVMACIEGAEAQIDAAIVAQSKDGRYDNDDRSAERELRQEEADAASSSALVKAREAVRGAVEAHKSESEPEAGTKDAEMLKRLTVASVAIDKAIVDQALTAEKNRAAALKEDEYWLREQDDVPEEERVDLSADGRKAMAKAGTAMTDGSYPIPNIVYLKKAIRAFDRANDKSAVKTWIKRRATALGATNLLPESWRGVAIRPNDSEDLLLDFYSQTLGFKKH